MVSQRLLLVISAFLASTTSAFHVMPSNPTPTTQLGYTATMDIPEEAQTRAFEKNVRDIIHHTNNNKQQQQQRGLPNMMDVTSRAEFTENVKNQQDKMTIVRFHAPYCRACKAMQPQWERFAREHPDINFVNIAFDKKNPDIRFLVNQLRVPKVPYGQIYHPEAGLVEKAHFGKQYFGNVAKHIEWYENGECHLSEDVDQETMMYETPYMHLTQ